MSATLVWMRQDLRLGDNPALVAAALRGRPVIPVYIWSPDEEGEAAPGAAARVWLHHALAAHAAALRAAGSRLILRRGPVLATPAALAEETGADAVMWNRVHEPTPRARDAAAEDALRRRGLEVRTFPGALLFEPEAIASGSRRPFQVFTAFWRACLAANPPAPPLPPPETLASPTRWPDSLPLASLALRPTVDWAGGIRAAWSFGERAAHQRLAHFCAEAVEDYPEARDHPDAPGTSRLSPHLHHGEITPRQIWHAVRDRGRMTGAGVDHYLRELGWREFGHHLLVHFPSSVTEPLRPAFRRFPWVRSAAHLRAWQRGATGYPIVDAGLRELWTTGWMHNRVRLLVGSFLVKHLLLPWQDGARWFRDTLVDADLASNTMNWQWVAGCGADAAPYFRIFNPVIQARRFDAAGGYIHRWVPELARLPAPQLFAPWDAPAAILAAAGVRLGDTYPRPIVDHASARQRALAAFEVVKAAGKAAGSPAGIVIDPPGGGGNTAAS